MTLTPRPRKFLLTVHVTCTVGWLGAVACFLALAIAGLRSEDAQMVRASYLAMGFIAWFVIVPLSLASLASGLVQALATPWGLFRHYWVLAKLMLTLVATIVLLLKMESIGYMAAMAAETTLSGTDFAGLRKSLTVHAGGGLLVLLATAALGVFKPGGVTRYGARKQRESSTSPPRWAKAFGIIVILLVLLVGIMMLTGKHGPGAHALPGS
jgi:hypothetical protein